MSIVTLSSKYQVVIPKEMRKGLALSPGDAMTVVNLGDRIEILPARPAKALRGLIRGKDLSFPREKKGRPL